MNHFLQTSTTDFISRFHTPIEYQNIKVDIISIRDNILKNIKLPESYYFGHSKTNFHDLKRSYPTWKFACSLLDNRSLIGLIWERNSNEAYYFW